MKRILIVIIGLTMIISSCEDYLEEDNRSSITTDEFYRSQEGFETLVNSSYSSLRELYTDMNVDDDNVTNLSAFQGMTMLGTDLFCVAKLADQNDIMDSYYQLTPDHNWVNKLFANGYKAIQLHNLAIKWSKITEDFEELPIRVAEVKFIRAYVYHILVEMYGGVSIVTEAFDSPVNSFERDSEEDVYQFIIDELEEIIEILPDIQDAEGRVTKGSAQHLLSLVYLSRGYTSFAVGDDFAKAEQHSTSVIESGNYNLLSEFEDVFSPGNENNREIIFSIQFDQASLINGVSGHSNHAWGGLFASTSPGMPYRHGQMRPTDRAFLQFAPEDERFAATFMVNHYSPYYDYYDNSKPEEEKTIETVYPHPSIVFDPENPGPTNYIYGADYTVWVPFTEEWEDQNYPWLKKFDDPNAVTRNDNSRDIFVFRLAETYLIRAEAKIGQGLSGDADINEVRARSWDVQVSGATLDDLLDERARELMGESKRWMDLRRTGKLKERVVQHNPSVVRVIGQNPFGTQDGKALRRPIPTDVIIRDSGEYGQNVGY